MNVPPVVLGAVLAALIAAGTAWINNKFARKNIEMQLGHARMQAQQQRDHEMLAAKQERELELRREVYVHATAWATDVVRSVSGLLNLQHDLAWSPANADAPGRVLIVGSTQTIAKCFALQNLQVEILRKDAMRRARLQLPHRRMLQLGEIVRTHSSGAAVPNIQAVHEELDQLFPSYVPELRLFATDLAPKFERVIEFAADFQISMSRDLGFQPDERGIRDALREYNKAGRAAIESLYEELDRLVSGKA